MTLIESREAEAELRRAEQRQLMTELHQRLLAARPDAKLTLEPASIDSYPPILNLDGKPVGQKYAVHCRVEAKTSGWHHTHRGWQVELKASGGRRRFSTRYPQKNGAFNWAKLVPRFWELIDESVARRDAREERFKQEQESARLAETLVGHGLPKSAYGNTQRFKNASARWYLQGASAPDRVNVKFVIEGSVTPTEATAIYMLVKPMLGEKP